MIDRTPLESWIRRKIGVGVGASGSNLVKALEKYQIQRINETIEYARRNTGFYRSHLAAVDTPLSSLTDIASIPFTESSDISNNPFGFLAVNQNEVARIVTLRTSGSTGDAKRLFFTEADLQLTIDFFHHGMSTLVNPGERVAVLLPGEKPDSVGDLLRRGLQRMDVNVLPYGPVSDPIHAARTIGEFRADCLVGIPTQVLAIARSAAAARVECVRNILLSTDYVPKAIARFLNERWGCSVFNHYGMTEMGLGGGVDCQALNGYHLREADLYFEIVDHFTGKPSADGVIGEVVFTTLTRQGMPLIRYKTGDIAAMIPERCLCGTSLGRMDWVQGRWAGAIELGDGMLLLSELDEVLFSFPGLLDYKATLSGNQLYFDVFAEDYAVSEKTILAGIMGIGPVAQACAGGIISKPIVRFSSQGRNSTNGVSKRKINRK